MWDERLPAKIRLKVVLELLPRRISGICTAICSEPPLGPSPGSSLLAQTATPGFRTGFTVYGAAHNTSRPIAPDMSQFIMGDREFCMWKPRVAKAVRLNPVSGLRRTAAEDSNVTGVSRQTCDSGLSRNVLKTRRPPRILQTLLFLAAMPLQFESRQTANFTSRKPGTFRLLGVGDCGSGTGNKNQFTILRPGRMGARNGKDFLFQTWPFRSEGWCGSYGPKIFFSRSQTELLRAGSGRSATAHRGQAPPLDARGVTLSGIRVDWLYVIGRLSRFIDIRTVFIRGFLGAFASNGAAQRGAPGGRPQRRDVVVSYPKSGSEINSHLACAGLFSS